MSENSTPPATSLDIVINNYTFEDEKGWSHYADNSPTQGKKYCRTHNSQSQTEKQKTDNFAFNNPPELEAIIRDNMKFPDTDKYNLTLKVTSKTNFLEAKDIVDFISVAQKMFLNDADLGKIISGCETSAEPITSNFTFVHFLLPSNYKDEEYILKKMILVFKKCSEESTKLFISTESEKPLINPRIFKMLYPSYVPDCNAENLAENAYYEHGTVIKTVAPPPRLMSQVFHADEWKPLFVLLELKNGVALHNVSKAHYLKKHIPVKTIL